MAVFTMDGIDYNMKVIKLKRSFEVADSDSTGRTKDWVMHRDVVGTFYNYTLTFADRDYDIEDYAKFYQAISSPVESHSVTFPYNNETLSFQAYMTKGDDALTMINGKNIWGGLSIKFIAMEPQRKA